MLFDSLEAINTLDNQTVGFATNLKIMRLVAIPSSKVCYLVEG